ncbi:filamin/ABP280 repeat domain-containing protein, partial [Salmonella sp. s51228]|uniref:filamin/ABP280 repeat domain-containing protein n=1 Tax=Salmonella sp. s51228 TaxID=3159652 RepID=UPI00397F4B89
RCADEFICGSPIKIAICDCSNCKVIGTQLLEGKGHVGEPVTFKVNTDRGGKGTLAINPKGPSAGYSVEKRETHANEYECSFVPWEIGKTMVEILWGGFHVPGSPFQMLIEAALTSNVCNATGEGL